MTLKDLRNKFNELPNSIQDKDTYKAQDYLFALKDGFINEIKALREDSVGMKEFQHFTGLEDKSYKGLETFEAKLGDRIRKFNEICVACLRPDSKSSDFDDFKALFFEDSRKCKDAKLMTVVIDVGRDFYRIRGTKEDNPYELFDHKNMYMMSHDHSTMVSTARFNLSGYPCLYLAESLYLAWEECRRPDFHTANFTRFRNCSKLTVFDLTIPETEELKSEAGLFRAYLGLVCSAKAADKDKDHWQYRISNLFTRLIYQYKEMDGIKYVSSKRFENKNFRLEYARECAAYVFLPKSVDERHCKRLASSFEMTKAYSYFYFKLYGINFISTKRAATRDYDNTIFAFLEKQLQAEEVISCSEVINAS